MQRYEISNIPVQGKTDSIKLTIKTSWIYPVPKHAKYDLYFDLRKHFSANFFYCNNKLSQYLDSLLY